MKGRRKSVSINVYPFVSQTLSSRFKKIYNSNNRTLTTALSPFLLTFLKSIEKENY